MGRRSKRKQKQYYESLGLLDPMLVDDEYDDHHGDGFTDEGYRPAAQDFDRHLTDLLASYGDYEHATEPHPPFDDEEVDDDDDDDDEGHDGYTPIVARRHEPRDQQRWRTRGK